jgi:hypothetical protein
MLPVRVVREQARTGDRPVRKDLHEPPLGQQLADLVEREVIGNARPVQR